MYGSLFGHKPPLSRLEAQARQIAVTDLSPVARLFFDFAFPGFLGPAQSAPDLEGVQGEERAFLEKLNYSRTRRRYAGDILSFVGARESDLPRRRYHAICSPDGTDHGLLRAELDAYTDFDRSGFIMLFDMQEADEAEMIGYAPEPSIVGLLIPGKTAWTRFRDLAIATSPQELVQPIAALSEEQPLTVRMITSTHDLRVDNVLDLRLGEARDWFFKAYAHGVPGFPGYGEDIEDVIAPIEGAEDFLRMAPALQQVLPGGSMISQAIGADLRRRGVNGLVYPSARTDVFSAEEAGELVDWRGFNFVDYRGAPKALTPAEAGIAFASSDDPASIKHAQKELKHAEAEDHTIYLALDSLWTPPELADDLQFASEEDERRRVFQMIGPETRREQRMQAAAAAESQ